MRLKSGTAFSADQCIVNPCATGEIQQPASAKPDRRIKAKRRAMIDPATCDRLYTPDDVQFMTAMDHYKRDNRRPFPTWSEALEVLLALGYRRIAEPTQMPGLGADLSPKVEE